MENIILFEEGNKAGAVLQERLRSVNRHKKSCHLDCNEAPRHEAGMLGKDRQVTHCAGSG